MNYTQLYMLFANLNFIACLLVNKFSHAVALWIMGILWAILCFYAMSKEYPK